MASDSSEGQSSDQLAAFGEFFASVREAAGPRIWSKAVEIARQEAVRGDGVDGGGLAFTVQDDVANVARRVRLFVTDGEWECDCAGDDDPCRHVAAAAIAYRRARERGEALPQAAQALGRLRYRLRRDGKQLVIERTVLLDGREEPLPASVAAIVAGRIRGPRLAADSVDLAIDLALGTTPGGAHVVPVTAAAADKLLAALAGLEDLQLDGRRLRPTTEPIGLAVRLRDEGPGVRLTGEPDPDIAELFANGIALTKDGCLRPARVPQLTPSDQRLVREGRYFAPREFDELVGDIVPRLGRQLRIIKDTNRLAEAVRVPPRLAVELRARAGELVVTPYVVYGEPPLAKVTHDQLHALGDVIPTRDVDEERRLRDVAWQELRLELDRPQTFGALAAVKFVSETLPALRTRARGGPRLGLVVVGDGARAFALHPALRPLLHVDDDDLTLDFVTGVAGTGAEREPSLGQEYGQLDGQAHASTQAGRASAEAVFGAYARGEALVPLLDGGFAPLPADWLARHGERLRDLLEAKAAHGSIPRPLLPTLAAVADDAGLDVPPALAALRRRFDDFTTMAAFQRPADLQAELRSYQEDGARWLAALRNLECGALLADDMGLGKTLQAICVLTGKTLIVAPTSVVPNWRREIEKFRPGLRVQLYHGAGRALADEADVTLTTYAILRLDQEALAAQHWDAVVLDEAQAIKNPDSQATRAALRLTAKFRLCLSGTPVENRLEDLWSQMSFANPGLLGRRADFDERYSRRIVAGDLDAAERLRRRIRPFVLRRLKSEVARELPPRTDTTLYIDLSAGERAVYEAVLAAARRDVVARLDAGATALDALEALLRLRQACCDPALLPGGVPAGVSSKLEALGERLGIVCEEGHRALVFSQWTSLLDRIEPVLAAAGIAYLRLDGGTRDRESVVAAFQASSGPPVLLMSLKAGGVGLNLTAADHVFIVDPWWNPAAEDQAADRAHRIGQTRPVQVHRLVAVNSVEERILLLQERKRALASAVTTGAGQAALTRDDLMSLFD